MAIDAGLLQLLNSSEEALRIRVGVEPTDDTKDATIQVGLEATLGLIEDYLDRKLQKAADKEEFWGHREAFMTRRWPIEVGSLTLTDQNGQLDFLDGRIDEERGIILHRAPGKFVAEYVGGFEQLPVALAWAFLAGFDALWAATPGMGAVPGSGVIMGTGAVKKVSLVGIGAVDLDVGATALKTAADGATSLPWSVFPATATAIFDRYRRESAVGAG